MAGESIVRPQVAAPAARGKKAPLVYAGFTVPFVLLICCFAAWGSAANLTDVLVGVFRHIFTMSNFESALVQFAYYGAYFSLAIPAAIINRRYGYKRGVLTGLGLATIGGILFYPASKLLEFLPFLVALFVLAAGLVLTTGMSLGAGLSRVFGAVGSASRVGGQVMADIALDVREQWEQRRQEREEQRREREAQVRRANSLAEREQIRAERAAKGEAMP
jgi:hypothetical protein